MLGKSEMVEGKPWAYKTGAQIRVRNCSLLNGDSGGPWFARDSNRKGAGVGLVQGPLVNCLGSMQDLKSTLKVLGLKLIKKSETKGAGNTGASQSFNGNGARAGCDDRPGYYWDEGQQACVGFT